MRKVRSPTNQHTGFIPVRDLAREFDKDLLEFRKWLLRHDFNLGRTLNTRTVLTRREAEQARFIHRHGIVCQEIFR